ncbi:porin [Bradyrhizobium sp. Ai1a-2]|uniref:porin n=1 Tax=Bradyrhizobium sp. Ai1a-2 TaxID=196490 RepID=UPI000424177F|nr:porin [Bradyrhizobium sp. Ai1a-2]
MAKLGICAAFLLAVVGASGASDAWAADVTPTKAPQASSTTPRPCTDAADFVTTNCQLTWEGITVFGIIDTGFGWQSHGASFDPRSAVGASYLIQKQNRLATWTLAPNALSNSTIGIKGTRPIGEDFSFVFDLDAGFDPYSLRFSNGPGAIAANNGVPQNLQTAYSDSSRAGQWYNGQGYVGVSSPTYGTLTVFRQNSLTLDAVFDYDPFGASYGFSAIGFQGITCGGGNTENCRHSTSVKYRYNFNHFRAAALWQFGGYDENNASTGAYQFQLGGDIPIRGNDVLSVDAIYSHVKNSVSLALASGANANNAFGAPIAPFLPQTLTATISDNTAAMFVARYTTKSLKLYAGYEYIRYEPPSNAQVAFTDIAGNFLCQGCDAFNSTNISNVAFGVNGLGNKTFQVMWAGAKYSVTDDVDVIGAYYHYIQDSFFGTAATGRTFCSSSEHPQCAGTFDAISAAVDWKFAPKWDTYVGVMFTQVNGGLGFGFFEHSNVATTAGLRFRF